VAAYDSGIFDQLGNPMPALSGNIDDRGIVLAGDGGLGKEVGSLNLCDITQTPAKI